MLQLLQKHTVDLYTLAAHDYVKQVVEARSLITVQRFDLFAKLFYIQNRTKNKALALQVYGEHIKVFNPDLKEPGRTDKNGLQDFVDTFDKMIDYFETKEFDSSISIVPVSNSGVILDGSHRTAILAFYNKKVKILKFNNVEPVCKFDYSYFQSRGLSIFSADKMALEAIAYIDDIYIACLWPKMGKLRNRMYTMDYFNSKFNVIYSKDISMSLDNLTSFILEIYKHQDWVGTADNNFSGAHNKALNCYNSINKTVKFVLFQAKTLELVQQAKEDIRGYYNLGKHVIHITDNKMETVEIADLIFTENVNKFNNGVYKFSDTFNEYLSLFKNVYLLKIKIIIAKLLKKIGLYKK